MLADVPDTSETPVKKHRIRKFLRRYNVSITLAFGFLFLGGLYVWDSLPAPWNIRYRINLATKNASFVCRDATYSWAVEPQGACSGHGGIKMWVGQH